MTRREPDLYEWVWAQVADAHYLWVFIVQLPDEQPVIVGVLDGDALASIVERPPTCSAISGVLFQGVGSAVDGIKEVDGACSFQGLVSLYGLRAELDLCHQ